MSEIQVPTTTLRRSQRISVSQASSSSRGGTPVSVPDAIPASTKGVGTGIKFKGAAKEKEKEKLGNEKKTMGGRIEKEKEKEMKTVGGRVGKGRGSGKGAGKRKMVKGHGRAPSKESSHKAAKESSLPAPPTTVQSAPSTPISTNAPTTKTNPPPTTHHQPSPPLPRSNTNEPQVPRIHPPHSTWSSTPSSLPFLTHSLLPTTPSTTTIALNILDYMILPSNWNPSLSHNRLASACFFFAGMVTELQGVSATEVAGASGWVHIAAAAEYGVGYRTGFGFGFGELTGGSKQEMLKLLDVSRKRVVEGYGILWEVRKELRGCCGGLAGRLEGLPTKEEVEGWEEKEREVGRRHWKVVEGRMREMGFEKWSGIEREEEEVEVEEEVEEKKVTGEEKVVGEEPLLDDVVYEERESNAGKVEPSVLIDLELEEFEDFVASNE